jgi:hypothetical protein
VPKRKHTNRRCEFDLKRWQRALQSLARPQASSHRRGPSQYFSPLYCVSIQGLLSKEKLLTCPSQSACAYDAGVDDDVNAKEEGE